MTRPDGRAPNQLRPLTFERDFTEMADGSCLVSFGRTRVLCTASIDDDVPRWMRGNGEGWVTAEYSMLPGSTPGRASREAARGKQSGRTVEIQRLIGRSLRAACDMKLLGERQIVVDCDAIQADGGTRTASICGGYIALHDALSRAVARGDIATHPLHSIVSAISVGIVDGEPLLDLPYVEDSAAQTDMNVVTLSPLADEPTTTFVEVQGTAEGVAFSRAELDRLLDLATEGLVEIAALRARNDRNPAERPMKTTLVCASANPDKVAEIRAILGDAVELLPRPDSVPDVVEDADTLAGNARLKARAICAATGHAAVADDTGLEVDALDGAPGVHSARYAGDDASYGDNRHKLLAALDGVTDRQARFRTSVVVAYPDGSEIVADGVCDGEIATAERGSGGFGYDSVFVPADGDGRSFSEMSRDEKHAISHRGRAFHNLLRVLP